MAATSINKLGAVGVIPIVPMMPFAGQVRATPFGLYLHLRLQEGTGGAYVSGRAPTWAPEAGEAIKAAYYAAPDEPSYSGTGNPYKPVKVVPEPDGRSATLYLGDVKLGLVYVDPTAQILSVDGDGEEAGQGPVH